MSKDEYDIGEQIAGGAIIAREQISSGAEPSERQAMLTQTYILAIDDEIERLAEKDTRVKKLLPALSHLVRTSRMVDDKEIKRMKLRWELACRMTFLVTPQRSKVADYPEFLSWLNFGLSAINDQFQGWRGKLVTEQIRTYRIEKADKEQRKLFGIIPWGKKQ